MKTTWAIVWDQDDDNDLSSFSSLKIIEMAAGKPRTYKANGIRFRYSKSGTFDLFASIEDENESFDIMDSMDSADLAAELLAQTKNDPKLLAKVMNAIGKVD